MGELVDFCRVTSASFERDIPRPTAFHDWIVRESTIRVAYYVWVSVVCWRIAHFHSSLSVTGLHALVSNQSETMPRSWLYTYALALLRCSMGRSISRIVEVKE